MNPVGEAILAHLQMVDHERAVRAEDARLQSRVQALKRYQQARFRCGYADLMQDRRYADAAKFFLEELYGPGDFSDRDAQFARIVPALVRLFPHEIVETVSHLAALHALSERLDTRMAQQLDNDTLSREAYVRAWLAVGEPEARRRQIELTVQVGRSLDRYTRNPLLRHSLRLMRGPARATGLAALQAFLERGFETFRAMPDAEGFLSAIGAREDALRQRLFSPGALGATVLAAQSCPALDEPLGQLP